MPKTIPSWSFSRLQDYESCPYKLKLKVIDRVPEPPRALPPGKTEHPLDRGTRLHGAAEAFVKGGVELASELASFSEELHELHNRYGSGLVSLEGEWAFDDAWQTTAWSSDTAWARVKLDALVTLSEEEAVVIDYKTGKKAGNEVKHADQMQLYQLATFLRYPKFELITVELWYTDQNDMSAMEFTREQGLRFFRNFDERARKMTTDTSLEPRPNKFVCGRCPYKDLCEHSAASITKKRKIGRGHGSEHAFAVWGD